MMAHAPIKHREDEYYYEEDEDDDDGDAESESYDPFACLSADSLAPTNDDPVADNQAMHGEGGSRPGRGEDGSLQKLNVKFGEFDRQRLPTAELSPLPNEVARKRFPSQFLHPERDGAKAFLDPIASPARGAESTERADSRGCVVQDEEKANKAEREYSEFVASLDIKQKNAVKVLDTWFKLKASVGKQMSEFDAENEMLRRVIDKSRHSRSKQISDGDAGDLEGEQVLSRKLDIGAEYLEAKGHEPERNVQKKIARYENEISIKEDEIREVRKELDCERAASKNIKESCTATLKKRKKEAEGLRAALRRSKKENEALKAELNELKQSQESQADSVEEEYGGRREEAREEEEDEEEEEAKEVEEKEIETRISNEASPPLLQQNPNDTSAQMSTFRSYDRKVLHSRRTAKGKSTHSTTEEICYAENFDVQESEANSYATNKELERGNIDEQKTEAKEEITHLVPEKEIFPETATPTNTERIEVPKDEAVEQNDDHDGDTSEFLFSDLLEMNHPDATQVPKARPKFHSSGCIITPNDESVRVAQDGKTAVETVVSIGSGASSFAKYDRPKRGKIAECLQNLEKNTGSNFILRAPSPASFRGASSSPASRCVQNLNSHSCEEEKVAEAPTAAIAMSTRKPLPAKHTWTKTVPAEQNAPLPANRVATAPAYTEKTPPAFTNRAPSHASGRGASSSPSSKFVQNLKSHSCEEEKFAVTDPTAITMNTRTPLPAKHTWMKKVPAEQNAPLPANRVAKASTSIEKTPPTFTIQAPSPASVHGASSRTVRGASLATASMCSQNLKSHSCEEEKVTPAPPASSATIMSTPLPAKHTWMKKVPAEQNTPSSAKRVAKASTSREKTQAPSSNRFDRTFPSSKPIKRTELACVTPTDRSVQNRIVRSNPAPPPPVQQLKGEDENSVKYNSSENCPPPPGATKPYEKSSASDFNPAAMHTTPPSIASGASMGAGTNSTRKELEQLRGLLKGRGREKKEQFESTCYAKDKEVEEEHEKNRYSFQPSWAKNN